MRGDVDAEARGLRVPQAEHVDDTAEREDAPGRDGDVRRKEGDVAPARARQRAEDPRVDLLERVGVLLLDERLQRGEEACDHHAREHERRRIALPSRRAAHGPRDDDGDGASDERGERQQLLPVQHPRQVRDRKGRAEPGTRGDAEEVGVGERVVEDALVRRARDGEHARRRAPRGRRGARGAARGSSPTSRRAASSRSARGARAATGRRRRARCRAGRRARRRRARPRGTRPRRSPSRARRRGREPRRPRGRPTAARASCPARPSRRASSRAAAARCRPRGRSPRAAGPSARRPSRRRARSTGCALP